MKLWRGELGYCTDSPNCRLSERMNTYDETRCSHNPAAFQIYLSDA